MAKITKGKLIVLRSRSTGVALIAIMGFLIAGFVFEPIIANIPNTLPQANPDEFEIPFVTEEQMQQNEMILEEINDVLKNPEEQITIDPELIQQSQQCSDLIATASQPNSQVTVTQEQVDQCNAINNQVQQQTQQQTQEVVDTLQDNIVVPPPDPNPTESSTDPPLTQIGDIVADNPVVSPILPQTPTLELVTKVTKIDSLGNRVVVEKTTSFSKLAFLVEEQTNVDYRNGKLEVEFSVKGTPNTKMFGVGTMDLKVGSSSIFASPVGIRFSQVSDGNGMVPVKIISPTGIESSVYTFDFNDNFNRFTDGSITGISIIIKSLDVGGDGFQNTACCITTEEGLVYFGFTIKDATVFTMDIARDDIQAIITNEQGVTTRIYPSDSRIILTTIAGTSAPAITYTYRVTTYDSIFYGNGRGCSQFSVISDVTYPAPTSGGSTYPVPAPSISGISVLDYQGNVITTSAGGSGKVLDYTGLTRNQNYKLKVTSPSITSTDLVYGKSQETKSYTCQQSATPNLTTVSTTSGNTSICGLYTVSSSYVINPSNPITLGAITCNIP